MLLSDHLLMMSYMYVKKQGNIVTSVKGTMLQVYQVKKGVRDEEEVIVIYVFPTNSKTNYKYVYVY